MPFSEASLRKWTFELRTQYNFDKFGIGRINASCSQDDLLESFARAFDNGDEEA